MPSKTPKQAKTMSAIKHGWKPPPGSEVAQIPLRVAKDFHRADAGKKWGQKHNLGKKKGK